MLNKTEKEIYWIAGLLEGEGCFQLNKPNSIMISLEMIDEDTIRRAAKIIDSTANVREYEGRTETRKTTWKFQISGEIAIEWMQLLFPIMSKRRQEKISELLEIARNRKLLPMHITLENRKKYDRIFNQILEIADKEYSNE